MKAIIVDDQYDSKTRIVASVLDALNVDVKHVSSAKQAIDEMLTCQFNILILDMQIPQRLGDEIDPNGGTSLLKFIELNERIKKPTFVLGVTSHPEAYEISLDFFKDRGWTLLCDQEGSLESKLRSILQTQISHLKERQSNCDVFIVTALAHTELEAVLNLSLEWSEFELPGRPERLHRGYFFDKNQVRRTVIATHLPNMGMISAAVVSSYACANFKPRYLIMPGIAAGIVGKVNLGDILVGSPCWDWGSGKLAVRDGKPHFLSSPIQIPLDPELLSLLQGLAAKRTYLNEIFINWTGGKVPPHSLAMHVGPIASGAVVLEDPETVNLITQQNRNTIGVEMEAFGVMSAAYYAGQDRPNSLIIKSVCDFADPSKNNEWQTYAAYTSAGMVYKLMRFELNFN